MYIYCFYLLSAHFPPFSHLVPPKPTIALKQVFLVCQSVHYFKGTSHFAFLVHISLMFETVWPLFLSWDVPSSSMIHFSGFSIILAFLSYSLCKDFYMDIPKILMMFRDPASPPSLFQFLASSWITADMPMSTLYAYNPKVSTWTHYKIPNQIHSTSNCTFHQNIPVTSQ